MKKGYLLFWVFIIGLVNNAKSQTLNFSLSTDTVTVGDTLYVANTSTSFPPSTVFVWNKGEYCYTINLGIQGEDVLTNDSLCNDTVTGVGLIQFVYFYPGEKTITLKVAGTSSFFSKQVYVKPKGGCFSSCGLANGDFEMFNTNYCPYTSISGTGFIAFPQNVPNILNCWTVVPPGTSDFFTQACGSTTALGNFFGGSLPHSADSYVGLIPYVGTPTGNLTQYREYFTQQLSFAIRPNCDYHLGVYAKIASNSINPEVTGYGDVGLPLQVQLTNAFPNQYVGATYLLDINSGPTYSFTPAISSNTNWQFIETTFNSGALTGTQFLTVGNYFNNANTQLTDPLKNDKQIYIFLDSLFIEFVDFTATISDVTCVQNGSINLTSVCGTAPFTYQWSNGATASNITNLTSGNYTVTITDSHGLHFTDSYVVLNTSCAPLLSATVNNTCTGSCNGQIDLSVSGNCTGTFTYLWSNGATTEDITDLCAGTYTVTVTAQNGCTATASYTVVSATIPVISFNYYPLQCQGTYMLVNPTPGVDYYWDFRDNSNSLIFSNAGGAGMTSVTLPQGAQPSVLTITANNNGCKATRVYDLGECCPPDPQSNDFAVYGDVTLSQLVPILQANRPTWVYGNGTPYQSFCLNYTTNYTLNTFTSGIGVSRIFIYGNLTIDTDVALYDFSIVMAADREIIINSNKGLYMSGDLGVTFSTCGKYMWRGIRMLGVNSRIASKKTSTFQISGYNYVINDAINGIYSAASSKVYLTNVLFNRNYNGIYISNGSPVSNNSVITGCYFGSRNNALTADQVLLDHPQSSSAPTRTKYAIFLSRINDLTIGYDEDLYQNGTYSSVACDVKDEYNHFVNADYGIWTQRCLNTRIYRNNFLRLQKGIRATGAQPTPSSLFVGKGAGAILGTAHDNTFDQIQENGIELVGNVQLTAEYNNFNNTTYITGSSNKLCSYIEFNNAYSPNKSIIRLNEFNDYYYAAIYLHNNSIGTADVDVIANKFIGKLNNATGNPWSVYGIYADAVPSNKYTMNIYKNSVFDDTRYGIRIRNNNKANIVGNVLTYHMPSNVTFPNNSYHVRGIFLTNSAGSNVESNRIVWSNYPAGFSASYPDKLQGIRLEDVTASSNLCNLMDGMGAGVYIENNNIGTSYTTNVIKNCYNGYKLNNAAIDPVGTPSVSNYNTFNNITDLRVAGTSPLPKPWYYNDPNDNPSPNSPYVIIPLSSNNHLLPCTAFTDEGDSSQMRTETEMLQQVINNETEFNQFEEENRYLTEEAALKLLKADSLLIDTLPNTQSFVQANEMLGKGKYIEAEKALAEGNTGNAAAIMATITDYNLMEENKRAVMEIIIKINDSIPPTAADTALLESIAYTPAIIGGTAVYMARGILAIEVEDEWLISSFRTANDKQKENTKNELYLFPNPAKDFVFIKCTGSITYEITDAAGKKYLQGGFNLGEAAVVSINIGPLSQGVYIVKVTQADCSRIARLVVIK
ncbi:MAG: T9SS type A sorting domain-containing protein [Bacteroidia bacterium]|nr:T9SS type A sorting domain-containing protein [Bacteroidia bacterium]